MNTESIYMCMFVIWLLLKVGKSQPYYYEEDPVYYPELNSSQDDEFYEAEPPQQEEQEGSMRALVNVRGRNDMAIPQYHGDPGRDVTFNNTLYDEPEFKGDITTRKYLDGYKQEVTTVTYDKIVKPSKSKLSTTSSRPVGKEHLSNKNDVPLKADDTIKYAIKQNDNRSQQQKFNETAAKNEKIPRRKFMTPKWIEATTKISHETVKASQIIAANGRVDTLLFPIVRRIHKESNTSFSTNSTEIGGNSLRNVTGSLLSVSSANSSTCDVKTHSGCDVIHYERCHPVTKQCQCLNGYLREDGDSGSGACIAVKFYHGQITVSDFDQLFSTLELDSIKQKLFNLIQLIFRKQGIDGFLDLEIHSVENKGQLASLTIELGMDKALLPGQDDIEHVLNPDFVLKLSDDVMSDAPERSITRSDNNNNSSGLFSSIVEVNPCINKDHNHCSPQASCRYTAEAVSCECNAGYEDMSPNVYRLSGEVCIEKCKCQNGGVCVDADVLSGTKQCSCLNWYFGLECQIDGKELLLICCCSIGSLIILCLTMCCCYYGCAKHRDNAATSRMFNFSPDINILKLPRVWMDTTSFQDNDLSPSNNRRLSIASERNPYFEGFIMEDIPLGTLQRHPEPHTSYYQTPLAHCPATVSSHSFYRY